MEQAFDLIEQGNHACDDKDYWKASHCFHQASQCLQSLTTTNDVSPEIAELCGTQSKEYKQKARDCFVQALQQQQQEPLSSDIPADDDDHQVRLELFAYLYSDPKLLAEKNTYDTESTTLEDLSLRLQALHAFQIAPKQTKMDELNAGLRRLGLEPVTSTTAASNRATELFAIESHKSPDEQVDALLQQVQEQVRVIDTHAAAKNDESHTFVHAGDEDESSSMDEQMQIKQLLQQVRDEQRVMDSHEDALLLDTEDASSGDETNDEQTAAQNHSSSILPLLLSAETADAIMKDTLEAELLLTQVLGLLEVDEESSLDDTMRPHGHVVQTLLRRARCIVRRAEQKAVTR